MINTALTVFAVSFLLGAIWLIVVNKERRRKRRFFALALRNWLDTKVVSLSEFFGKVWEHFSKYIVQLSWYYSIHSVLKAILRLVVAFYAYMENIFERNRTRTKRLRSEKRQLNELNHLQQMANHKQDTALSASEKRKLRKRKLEEKH